MVYLAECSPIAEAVSPTPVPAGTPVVVNDGNADWRITVEKVNDDAWKTIRRADRFNKPPGRGNRYVLITVSRGHGERGSSYNPRLAWDLWAGDDSYSSPALILPDALMNRHVIQGIPGGRYPRFGLAFPVPKDVKKQDLRLIVTGASESAEMALVRQPRTDTPVESPEATEEPVPVE